MNDEQIRQIENIEINAWGDFYKSAETMSLNPSGIYSMMLGSTHLSFNSGQDSLALNRILGLGQQAETTKLDIEELIEKYQDAGIPRFFVQIAPLSNNQALSEILLESGFEHYNNWMKLYYDVVPLGNIKSKLVIKEIDQAHANDFARIIADAFEWGDHQKSWVASIVGRSGWHHYMAFDQDKPVATGSIFIKRNYAWVDFAATDPDYRSQGAQAMIMKKRIEEAMKCGVKTIVVETAQETKDHAAPSFRNMVRFGFKTAYIRPNFLYKFYGLLEIIVS